MSNKWEDLIVDEIRGELIRLSEQKGITKPIISFTNGSELGDNYLGEIVNVIIEGDNEKQNGKKHLDIIVKCAPRVEGFRAKVPIRQLYLREMFVYDIVFKEFLKIQEDCNVKDVFNPFAVCYKTVPTDGFETLIMKNMKSIGYYMEDRCRPLDYDHVLVTIRSYSKLHALSFALRKHDPEKFRQLTNNLKENFFTKPAISDSYFIQITQPVFDLLEEPLKGKFDSYRLRLKSILKEELCEETPGQYAVIGHGDCWTNNFLFKKAESGTSNKPTSVIFLDWQLCRMSSPFADLFYFLFVCTDKEFRDEHFYNLMDEYYESFSNFLRILGCDPGEAFPRQIFDEHMKRFMGYGVCMALSAIKLLLAEKNEIPDFKNMSQDKLSKFDHSKYKPGAAYEKLLTDVIVDAKKYGCVYLQ